MKAEQLRKSILQMAIQGKLVPQDPTDEPASVLLEKIRAEKQKLIKEGKIKKDKFDSVIFKGDDNRHYEKIGKEEPKCIDDEVPFDIPDSWEWVRLGYLISIISGVSYDKKDVCQRGIRILRGGNINNLQVTTFQDDIFLPKSYKDSEKQVRVNDIVIVASTGSKAVIGKAGYIERIIDNTQIGAFLRIVRPLWQELVPYIKLIFATDYYREHIRTQSQGTNINNVKAEYITQLLTPFPPLAEQVRIVDEIGKYTPLIEQYDKLEQEKSKLDGEIYDKLKKSILQYAIQGKLVPQDPNDEPASVLLERIRAEKKAKLGKKYVDSYIYKGDDNCYYEHIDGKITDEPIEIPFDIPENWCWARIREISTKIVDGDHNPPSGVQYKTEYIMISSTNINNDTITNLDKVRYLTKEIFEKENERTNATVGDIFFTTVGSIGRSCIYNGEIKICFQRSVSIITTKIFNYYLKFCLDSQYVQNYVNKYATGTAQKGFYLSQLADLLIPVPPQEEQQRIVNKLNEIFAKL